jgi:exosortase C (VPDSG-CTERM-specific)
MPGYPFAIVAGGQPAASAPLAEGNGIRVREIQPSSVFGSRSGIWTTWRDLPRSHRARFAGVAVYAAAITALFATSLVRLFAHAAGSGLHSHIPLVPLVAGYLLYIQPRKPDPAASSAAGTIILGGAGAAALTAAVVWRGSLSVNDHLAFVTLAYLSFVTAGGFLFLGSKWMSAAVFPVAFLLFMVPLPDAAVYWLERGSVLASADVSALFFRLTGTPLLREGTIFAIPGIVLEVAQECSGIRSSWVLFITSVVASHLFLDSRWRRIVLVAFVFPLAIVRNAFRILVIGLLCVHVGPHMIDSVIHTRGGPIFFALSLVPLFLLLGWLRRGDRKHTGIE